MKRSTNKSKHGTVMHTTADGHHIWTKQNLAISCSRHEPHLSSKSLSFETIWTCFRLITVCFFMLFIAYHQFASVPVFFFTLVTFPNPPCRIHEGKSEMYRQTPCPEWLETTNITDSKQGWHILARAAGLLPIAHHTVGNAYVQSDGALPSW